MIENDGIQVGIRFDSKVDMQIIETIWYKTKLRYHNTSDNEVRNYMYLLLGY